MIRRSIVRIARPCAAMAALLMTVSGCAAAQAPARDPTAALTWLAGCWERRDGSTLIEERWTPPRAGSLFGMSRTTRGESLLEFEFTRIHHAGDTLIFVAQPSGQPPTEFRVATSGDRDLVFENRTHDFPQRVRYRAVGPDSLFARIEGTLEGRPRGFDFPYRRVSCDAPSATR